MSAPLDTHAASQAAAAAMAAVRSNDRDAWLGGFAEGAVVYDPVGGSPLDPEGTGLRSRAALEQFWDFTVAPNEVAFDVSRVHAGGDEAAVVATASVAFPTGAAVEYDGVFVYRVDAAGKIAELRAYWDLDRVMQALAQETS